MSYFLLYMDVKRRPIYSYDILRVLSNLLLWSICRKNLRNPLLVISLKYMLSQDKRFAEISVADVATRQSEWLDSNLEILGDLYI
jgi:hypothetical protein